MITTGIGTGGNKCARHSIIHKSNSLNNTDDKTQNEATPTGSSFGDALLQFMGAHFEKATDILEKNFNENQDDVAASFLLAQCFRMQHRTQDMIAVYERFAKTNKLFPLMSFELALGYLDTGANDKAISILEMVAAKGPFEEAIAYHLAEAYFKGGRLISAIATLRVAVHSYPHSRRLGDFLARLLEVGDP